MTVDCDHRMTLEQALNHPWLADVPPPNLNMYESIVDRNTISPISLRKLDIFFGKELQLDQIEEFTHNILKSNVNSQIFRSIKKALGSLKPTAFRKRDNTTTKAISVSMY